MASRSAFPGELENGSVLGFECFCASVREGELESRPGRAFCTARLGGCRASSRNASREPLKPVIKGI